MKKLERLLYSVELIDKVTNPIKRIQRHLHLMGLEQIGLLRNGFHTYGEQAAEAARKVTLITAALGVATAATTALLAAAMPLAAAFGIGAVSALSTAHIAGVTRETEQLSTKTGMDSQTIRTWQLVSRTEGLESGFGELGDIGGIFEEISSKIPELDDKKSDFSKSLAEIGLSARQLKHLKPHEILNKASDRLDTLGKSKQDKANFLSELAGDAEKLIPLLGKNNQQFQRISQHARNVGAIITPEQTKLMQITNRETALMKVGMDGIANTFAEIGGNFFKLFGDDINNWFVDNHKALKSWAKSNIQELERLHGVFEKGGLKAVWEDLFPNFSAFLSRTGAFFSGFNQGFLKPFMEVSTETYNKVIAHLGTTAGGAKELGYALGASILPIFAEIMRATGDAVVFIESNWELIKKVFAWSPLGLIIDNWQGIKDILKPVFDSLTGIAEHFGIVATGVNTNGSALGTLFGIMGAGLGILILNKLAFGAIYHVVMLYKGALALLRVTTIAVTASHIIWNAVIKTGMAIAIAYTATMKALRAVLLATAIYKYIYGAKLAAAATWAWNLATKATAATFALLRLSVIIASTYTLAAATKVVTAATWAWNLATKITAATLALLRLGAIITGTYALAAAAKVAAIGTGLFSGALAILTSPITLIIGAVAALAAGAYYLYTHWDTVKASLSDSVWGGILLAAFEIVTAPLELIWNLATQLFGSWENVKTSLSDTTWGQAVLDIIDTVAKAFQPLLDAWDKIKNMDLSLPDMPDISMPTMDDVSKGWGKITAMVGFGDEPTKGAGKATGGIVNAGYLHKVNELAPELYTTGGATYLMTGSKGGFITPIDKSKFLFGGKQEVPTLSSGLVSSNNDLQPISTIKPRQQKSIASTMISINQQSQQQHNQGGGRVLHIDNLTIQTQTLDADKFMDELEMVTA